MIVLAVIPPLWRRVMDHRVLEHYGGEVERANLKLGLSSSALQRYRLAAQTKATAYPEGTT
jgi:alkane 1-monooxygenase